MKWLKKAGIAALAAMLCLGFSPLKSMAAELTHEVSQASYQEREQKNDNTKVNTEAISTVHFYMADSVLDSPVNCWSDSAHGNTYASSPLQKLCIPYGSSVYFCYDNLVTDVNSTYRIILALPDGTYYNFNEATLEASDSAYGYGGFTTLGTDFSSTGLVIAYLYCTADDDSTDQQYTYVYFYLIDTPIQITSSPSAQTVTAGKSATFTASATGTNLQYQWYYNKTNSKSGGTKISGATSKTYKISETTSSDGGKYYYCKISNYSNTSEYAKVTKTTTPALLTVKAKSISSASLSKSSFTYTGSAIKPSVKVKYGSKVLTNGTNYKVTYSNNKSVGKATLKVKGIGVYTGTKTLTYKIIPKGTAFTSVVSGSKLITLKWSRQATQTTGYNIQLATNSSFTKGLMDGSISKNTVTSLTKGSLKSGKTYYARIRTFKTVSGSKYYSSWSKTVSVKVK